MNRREFLKGTAWMGAAAVAAGCLSEGMRLASSARQGFSVKPLRKVRVGVVGLGCRGPGAVHRLASIPGVEVVALCDIHPERVAAQQTWLKEHGKPAAREYTGREGYKAMCESDLDVVYNATSWDAHVPIALYAMEHGKHAMIEVPSAFTLEECWALVETAERTGVHCMQLENCCYGEAELLALNLCKLGMFGELVHGEGAYIHDLRSYCYEDWTPDLANAPKGKGGYADYWRLRHNAAHKGNQYETHGLGPVCDYMDINRGDRFDYLVSLESNPFNFEAFARDIHPDVAWKRDLKVAMGDMNTTLVKTVKGRSIMIQHDVASPRPYSRINRITGTKGAFEGLQFRDPTGKDPYSTPEQSGSYVRFGWERTRGDGVHVYFPEQEAEAMRLKYRHPLWRTAGEVAQIVGGHGGMDFLMDLRWCYCLQNGLPLDHDVYDLATWCCLGELTETSVRNRSRTMDVPDFTRGGWKTAKPYPIVDVDLKRMGFDVNRIIKDKAALNIQG